MVLFKKGPFWAQNLYVGKNVLVFGGPKTAWPKYDILGEKRKNAFENFPQISVLAAIWSYKHSQIREIIVNFYHSVAFLPTNDKKSKMLT